MSDEVWIGRRFGRWTALHGPYGPRNKWMCVCDCGRYGLVSKYVLLKGDATRCQRCANSSPRLREVRFPHVHPVVVQRLTHRVSNAIDRCTNPLHVSYKYYGGRGIKVCSGWLDDPVEFMRYLMTLPGWDDPDLVLDRSDNAGNYEPGNLRFVTWHESARNRRSYKR